MSAAAYGEVDPRLSPPRREAKLTVYPGVDHDAWYGTYSGSAGNDVYTWLLGFTAP